MNTRPDTESPLAAAVLAVVDPDADAADIEARLAAAGASLDAGTAGVLLARLADLGLVRVTRVADTGPRMALTSLGRRALAASLVVGGAAHAADLERLRTHLLSTIAHELRTPLTAVRTSVGLLLDPASEPTDDQRRTLLEAIERSAERMQRVVGDILDLARFRSGSIRLQLRRFDPIELARGAVASLEPLARVRRTRVTILGDPFPTPVYGDRRRMEQALVNLVSNALRHAPPDGRVDVRVDVRGELTAWSVRDDGPGIALADQDRLFERFFVGRGDRRGPQDGVGLGLPTSLAIAQAHGGTIEVRSAPGEGSTFTILVPTDGPEEVE